MTVEQSLAGRTIVMSGGSRGIGLAIAIRAARDGANIALLAKTETVDARLPGTIHTAARAIEEAGGQALPVVGDVRDEAKVNSFVQQAVDQFGSVDIVLNNASAIALDNIGELSAKRYDLMMDINCRGTFLLIKAALPHLLTSANAHVLSLSPPLNLDRKWFGHAPYTLSKYGMTMLTMGVAESYSSQGVSANCLWPRTYIGTAAVANSAGGSDLLAQTRTPEIMADAAYLVLLAGQGQRSGQCLIDEDVLRQAGQTDFDRYLSNGANEASLAADLFL